MVLSKQAHKKLCFLRGLNFVEIFGLEALKAE